MEDLTALAWTLLVVGAVIVGVSKTAIPGAATVSVAIFAAVLPARGSTATLLVLLIVGDVFALLMYRRHADVRTLLRLAPSVVAGMAVGALFLALADDVAVRRVIGGLLLGLVALTLWLRARARTAGAARAPGGTGRAALVGYGSLGGFTTMVANAGGPVMSLYFLAARFDPKTFLGTAAWFFAVVNVAKLPFAIGAGLLTPQTLLIDVLLVPGVVVGALVGRAIIARLDQRAFEWIVLAITAATAVYLVVA
ncbi:MAG TPA: sulfite exporter TauE/SafE family protein [Microbacterium sp.]|nr:sulfite exporter TauE/SafE family protein [Microbacterium sp.]